MDRKEIDALLKLMKRNGVGEFTYSNEIESLTVRFGAGVVIAQPVAAAPAPAEAPKAAAPAANKADNQRSIRSPIVGTFYRSPGPDADPYVKVGDHVRKGQVVCIVEAMKLMNQIESDLEGTIVEVLVDNGKPVQFGQELFRVSPA